MSLREEVLIVLAGQTPGYLCAPDAAAFHHLELEADVIQAELDALAAEGLIQHEEATEVVEIPAGNDAKTGELVLDEEERVVDRGWVATPPGLERAEEVRVEQKARAREEARERELEAEPAIPEEETP